MFDAYGAFFAGSHKSQSEDRFLLNGLVVAETGVLAGACPLLPRQLYIGCVVWKQIPQQ